MIRALLIDLDDTLYDERTYVLSGFRAVANELAGRTGDDAEGLLAVMVAELDANGRGRTFDRAVEAAGLSVDPNLIAELVALYRDHRPQIALWPGVREALAALAQDHRLALVTDGLHLMQRRKVEALGVRMLVDEVLFCWEHAAPKPDPTCYREALRRLDAQPEETVVVGDNPGHDMAAAAAVGCRSIRVRSGRFAAVEAANFPATAEVASFLDVAPTLRRPEFGGAQ